LPTPIFVVGIQRSGTTWLANELASMKGVVGVTSGKFGTRESHYFNAYVDRFGDITQPDNFALFASVMLSSDFFSLVGLDKAFLELLYPSDYWTIFYKVMARYADENQAQYWVEKTPNHTELLDEICKAYPDALVVATRRNMADVFTSAIVQERLWYNRRRRLVRMITHSLRHTHYNRIIVRCESNHENIVIVDYEDMKTDLNQVMRTIQKQLQLDAEYDPHQKQQFTTNTSSRIADFKLPKSELILLRLIYGVASLIPSFFVARLYRIRQKMRHRQSLPLQLFRLRYPHLAKYDPIVAEIIESEAD